MTSASEAIQIRTALKGIFLGPAGSEGNRRGGRARGGGVRKYTRSSSLSWPLSWPLLGLFWPLLGKSDECHSLGSAPI